MKNKEEQLAMQIVNEVIFFLTSYQLIPRVLSTFEVNPKECKIDFIQFSILIGILKEGHSYIFRVFFNKLSSPIFFEEIEYSANSNLDDHRINDYKFEQMILDLEICELHKVMDEFEGILQKSYIIAGQFDLFPIGFK